jgi:hypothetical protein
MFLRYSYVCTNDKYKKTFSKIKTIIYCLTTWIIGLLTILPFNLGFFGMGKKFDSKLMTCLWSRSSNKVYTYLVSCLGAFLPNIIVAFFYFKIFKTAYDAKKRAFIQDFVTNKKVKLSLSFSKGMFASYFCFMIAFLPYDIILILDFDDSLPRYIHMLGYILVKFNSLLNSILYGTTCELFWKGYKNFLNLIFNKKEYSYSLIKKERLERIHKNEALF